VYSLRESGPDDAGRALDATLTNLTGSLPSLRGFALVVQPVVASTWDEKYSPEVLRSLEQASLPVVEVKALPMAA
jgi:hypothetical protein